MSLSDAKNDGLLRQVHIYTEHACPVIDYFSRMRGLAPLIPAGADMVGAQNLPYFRLAHPMVGGQLAAGPRSCFTGLSGPRGLDQGPDALGAAERLAAAARSNLPDGFESFREQMVSRCRTPVSQVIRS